MPIKKAVGKALTVRLPKDTMMHLESMCECYHYSKTLFIKIMIEDNYTVRLKLDDAHATQEKAHGRNLLSE